MALKLLCDEHVGNDWFQNRLRKRHTVSHVRYVPALGPGTDDPDIWKYAVRNGYNVFTNDYHFVDGTADPGNGTHPGVIRYDDHADQGRVMDALEVIEKNMTSIQIANSSSEFFVPGDWV